MISILLFLVFVSGSCFGTNPSFQCVDEIGLNLCIRAQDRVNWLIIKTNDSMQPISLNCTQHVVAKDLVNYGWKTSQSYSSENYRSCLQAAHIFDELSKKYALKNSLPVECENLEISSLSMRVSVSTTLTIISITFQTIF